LCRAAAHSDCCFFAPCTIILTYFLTYLLQLLLPLILHINGYNQRGYVLSSLSAAGKLKVQQLECAKGQKMNVVGLGLMAMDARGRPASATSQTCLYLDSLLTTVQAKCSGERQCQLTAREFGVSKNQCPGVSAVNFRVNCIKSGGMI